MKQRFFLVFVILTVLSILSAGCSAPSVYAGKGLTYTVRAQNSEIWLWKQETDKLFNLTNKTGDDFWQTWSPDGKYMAFASDRSGELEIWILNLDKSETFNFSLSSTSDDGWPAWSPDGNKIVVQDLSKGVDGSYRFPVISTGASLRINLFGYLVLEPYFAFPLQNGGFRNGQFGLNFVPGW